MIAGIRPPSRDLILALGASIAMHLAVLFNIGSAPTHASKVRGALATRLVQSPGESAPAPHPAQPRDTPRPESKPRKAPVKTAPAPAPPRPAPPIALPAPSQAPGPDLPIDMRVREVVVSSPAIYGLAAKFSEPGRDLPYAWSDEIDTPPQATSMSRTQFPSGADRDHLVLVRAVVGSTGAIENPEVLCGAPPFEGLALESVPYWAFVPPTARGSPARAWLLLEFAFMRGNVEEGFDPSLADAALTSMRAACAQQLAAQPR